MKDRPANLPASVLARVRNIAREKETDYQFILRRYAIERLLHRLSISPHRDQFIQKGAMLFTAWLEDPFRPTQDLDLLGFGDPAVPAIRAVFEAVCQIEAEDDGLVFDTDAIAGDAVADALEATELLDVDVDQLAGMLSLIAARRALAGLRTSG